VLWVLIWHWVDVAFSRCGVLSVGCQVMALAPSLLMSLAFWLFFAFTVYMAATGRSSGAARLIESLDVDNIKV